MNYVLSSHSWDIHFKRAFGGEEMKSWEQLLQMLEPIFLSDQKDRVKWALEKNGEYSSKSMYRFLSFGGVSDPQVTPSDPYYFSLMLMYLDTFYW
jgi:hypothetical protein